MRRARERIHELTDRRRLRLPVEEVVQDVNRFLRGWAGCFRYGNSADAFDTITLHAQARMAAFVAKRHKRSARYGWWAIHQSPDRMGLINLGGTIVAPRPNRPRHRGS
jgi:RNA-directed DNA polymerase